MQTDRSFLYGESIFTTAHILEGRITFLGYHLERLISGADYLWGPLDKSQKESLCDRILDSLPLGSPLSGLRITLSYEDHKRSILRDKFEADKIKITLLPFERGELKNAKLKSYKVQTLLETTPHFLKNSNRTLQTIFANRSGLISHDESLLFCGQGDEIYESSWANIFAVKNNILFTPPISGNVLSGIMRDKILQFKNHQFLEVREESFDLIWLKSCDFVFLTNALWGVIPVERIDNTTFNQPIKDFFNFYKAILDEEIRS